ncbi:MAG: hypothetical protein GAK37_00216 [Pseudomonas sp.]|nr:MAG: hypothetical protein GAK37_00216 [Pseudomonas sp.]
MSQFVSNQANPYAYSNAPGRYSPAPAPVNIYANATDHEVGGVFANNVDVFIDPRVGVVTQQSLRDVASRPFTGNAMEDNMAILANEILRRPELNRDLGLDHGYPPAMDREMAYPPYAGPRFYGPPSLQRQPLEQPYVRHDRPYGAPFMEPLGGQEQRPFAQESDQDFSARVLPRFSSLEDPQAPGYITDRSLNAVASGVRLDGTPATPQEVEVALELLERGHLYKRLDRGENGTLDGKISRSDLDRASDNYAYLSDRDVIQGIKDNFRQYTAGGNDTFASVAELQEAAGLVPSSRAFTPQARAFALEVLNRPGLLRELDIGVGNTNGRGKEDCRFDMDNLNYMLDQASSAALTPM